MRQLRSLVFRSCDAWTEFLVKTFLVPTSPGPSGYPPVVTVRQGCAPGLERKEVWNTPLFDVELVVVGSKVAFSPSVEELHRYGLRRHRGGARGRGRSSDV